MRSCRSWHNPSRLWCIHILEAKIQERHPDLRLLFLLGFARRRVVIGLPSVNVDIRLISDDLHARVGGHKVL